LMGAIHSKYEIPPPPPGLGLDPSLFISSTPK
jgi:hypothetical protein